jgi:hypothetical protein
MCSFYFLSVLHALTFQRNLSPLAWSLLTWFLCPIFLLPTFPPSRQIRVSNGTYEQKDSTSIINGILTHAIHRQSLAFLTPLTAKLISSEERADLCKSTHSLLWQNVWKEGMNTNLYLLHCIIHLKLIKIELIERGLIGKYFIRSENIFNWSISTRLQSPPYVRRV